MSVEAPTAEVERAVALALSEDLGVDGDLTGALLGAAIVARADVVTRGDGGYVLGASSEERGFDTTVTARPLYELLRDASELVPGLLDLEVEEITVGLRPGSPDNLPLIGASDEDGLILACGHFRNGILLAPITATLVVGVLEDILADVRVCVQDWQSMLARAREEAEAALRRSERLTGDENRGLRLLLYLFERDEAARLIEAG